MPPRPAANCETTNMALAQAIKNARHTGQIITFKRLDGSVVDLTGATITARIKPSSGSVVAADGTFTLTSATEGKFSWTYGTTDVGTAGEFTVQFKATFADTTIEYSYPELFVVQDIF